MLQVANSLESIRSYSALIATLIMLIISDYLLYKPVVIILTFCSCITYILMVGLPNLTQLKVSANITYIMSIMLLQYQYTNNSRCLCFSMDQHTVPQQQHHVIYLPVSKTENIFKSLPALRLLVCSQENSLETSLGKSQSAQVEEAIHHCHTVMHLVSI